MDQEDKLEGGLQAVAVVVLEPIHREIQAEVVDLVDLLRVAATDH